MTRTSEGLEIVVRQETPGDYDEVGEVVRRAFATTGDPTVADYLDAVRHKAAFIPELSFVATLPDGRIVGQITLYKTDIVTPTGRRLTQLVLSPISVEPEFFRRGIAREMIVHALSEAREAGYAAVFLQGDPKFYGRFGFVPAHRLGIRHETDPDGTPEHCMVNVLVPGALDGVAGMTSYE